MKSFAPTSWLRHASLASVLLFVPVYHKAGECAEVEGLTAADREVLLGYARDTWKSMAAMAEGVELPADGLRRLPNGRWSESPQTTPTDIGAYLWSTLAAQRLGIITEDEATRRIGRILTVLERVDRVHGFFYDKIDPKTGGVLKKSPYDGKPIPAILSSVDNGWLALALMIVQNACPTHRDRAEALLRPMDFGFFYEPYDPGRTPEPSGADSRALLRRRQDVRRPYGHPEHRAADRQLHRDRARPDSPGALLPHRPDPRPPDEARSGPAARRGVPDLPGGRASSRDITAIGGCGSSRAGAGACSRR